MRLECTCTTILLIREHKIESYIYVTDVDQRVKLYGISGISNVGGIS